MKKIIGLLFVITMALSLVVCGNNGNNTNKISENKSMRKKNKRILFFAIMLLLCLGSNVFASTFDEQLENCCTVSYELPSTNWQVLNTVKFGRYPQSKFDGSSMEEIEWFVLDKGQGEATLISKYVLDNHQYANEHKIISWKDSELRRWLNEDFYNFAFNENEQQRILTSFVENDKESDTNDKVYILSNYELSKWLSKNHSITEGTNYAIREHDLQKYSINELKNDYLLYWVREKVEYWEEGGEHGYDLKTKENDGKDYSCMDIGIMAKDIGVRPVIKVKYNGKLEVVKQFNDYANNAIDAIGKAKEVTDKLGVTDDIVKEGAKGVAKKYLPGFLGDIAGKVIDGIGK